MRNKDASESRRASRRSRLRWLFAGVVALTLVAGCVGAPPPPPPPPPDRPLPPNQSFPGPACLDNPATVNRVACENTANGNPPTEWDVSGSGDPSIQGFATSISVNRGETVHFKIATDASLYHLEIYRMGFYGGAGARKVAIQRPTVLPQQQPNCNFTPGVNLVDCGNWAESAQWAVPADAASGIYFAKLVRDSGQFGSSHVFFIVRDDSSRSDLLYKTSDTTWQAYNDYGGFSFYEGGGGGENGAPKISYNRPFVTRGVNGGESWVFSAEYPMVRWLESNGYDLSYFTGVDTATRGSLITQHHVFMSSGHDEYWSNEERSSVEAAAAEGVNLAFFTGNTMYWKTRWEDSNRTLVCYKESSQKLDPSPVWTGLWRDPRFSPPSDGGRPENRLTGALYAQRSTLALTVPADDGKMRLWRNTSIAQQSPGQTATLPSGVLGYEWDEAIDTGGGGAIQSAYGLAPTGATFRPPGLIHLSTTTSGQVGPLQANDPELNAPGSNPRAAAVAPVTHHLTLYRAPSGALVFDAATVQWSWGLDSNHDGAATPTDARMQQATVNQLADMSAQPATLQAGLVAATKSTDTTPPSSVVTAPGAGATISVGQGVIIQGTASDTNGAVGGVEVSTDNGQTWNPASGRGNWIFGWTPTQPGTYTIRSRAVDDSANLEQPGPGLVVTVSP